MSCAKRISAAILAIYLINGQAAAPADISYQIKASYIYNFLQFVSFPDDTFHLPGILNVCILGEDRFGTALNEVDGAAVPQGVINIIRFDSYSEEKLFDECNALYVVETEKRHIQTILSRIDSKKMLTIGEFSPFIRYGGLIELFVRNDSIRFRINEELAKETHFQVAAQLIQLGVHQ